MTGLVESVLSVYQGLLLCQGHWQVVKTEISVTKYSMGYPRALGQGTVGYIEALLTLLHSEWPKVLAILSAVR